MKGRIVQIFKVIGRIIIAMAMNTNGVIKSVDILKNELLGVIENGYFKAIEPLAFDERMERFNTRIVIRITLF